MEIVLNYGLCELTNDELLGVNGGGIKKVLQVAGGTLLVAWSPAVCVGGGIIAGGGTLGLGLSLIGAGTH